MQIQNIYMYKLVLIIQVKKVEIDIGTFNDAICTRFCLL